MRRLAYLIGCALLVACGDGPTAGTREAAGVLPSYGGFGMGSGGRDGSVTDTTTSSPMGGHTMGGGAREGATVTDSTSGDAVAFGGIFGGSGN